MFFIKDNKKKIFLILEGIILVALIICIVSVKRFYFSNNKTGIDPTKAKYIISLLMTRAALISWVWPLSRSVTTAPVMVPWASLR